MKLHQLAELAQTRTTWHRRCLLYVGHLRATAHWLMVSKRLLLYVASADGRNLMNKKLRKARLSVVFLSRC